MTDKIFCGNARIIKTQYGELTKVSFSKEDINKMVTHMKSENSNWINLIVKEKKNKTEGKPTHYLEVDNWKPNSTNENDSFNALNDKGRDLPF
jgi:hypothetical protein